MTHAKAILFAMVLGAVPLVSATSASADWMAYAVDGRGKFGHSRAASQGAARHLALNFCGRPGCYVVAVTRARCTALASSGYRGGHWIGMGSASSRSGAMGYAIDWCSRNAPASTCNINHVYCK